MSDLGFIVIEWNQASGCPAVASNDFLYDDVDAAEEVAAMLRRESVGRGERYTIARVEGLGG